MRCIILLIIAYVIFMYTTAFQLRRLPKRIFLTANKMSLFGARSLDQFALSENTLTKYLVPEDVEPQTGDLIKPRQVKGAHYTRVLPEPVANPYFIAASRSCAEYLELDPTVFSSNEFVQAFSGNILLPGMGDPYCTVYGCHCYGQWFGQLGDGRAIGMGEVKVENPTHLVSSLLESHVKPDSSQNPETEKSTLDGSHVIELQLKGSGRSPFSRGFDGRAVVRSSVREFLVSEAMHHLGVPTTRALSLVGTGQEIRRPWYDANSQENSYSSQQKNLPGKFSPNVIQREPGAILCRVSKSFLRFGQLELFAKRGENDELQRLADYLCFREYPHLLKPEFSVLETEKGSENERNEKRDFPVGKPERYVEMYREIAKRTACLVAEWLRVGYVQGNMNSDNTLLGGRTLDYGPYGWMERYDPLYQPFTSDTSGNFAFVRQPNAMNINAAVLGQVAILPLVKLAYSHLESLKPSQPVPKDLDIYMNEVKNIAQKEFVEFFFKAYQQVKSRKLGISNFQISSGQSEDEILWEDMEKLMFRSGCDFTIFFRELSKVAISPDADEALLHIEPSFYSDVYDPLAAKKGEKAKVDLEEWKQWLNRYLSRLQKDNISDEERVKIMNQNNPKYVLRNWMCTLAYERAIKDKDYSIIEELTTLLENPYDEQTSEIEEKWYQKTPSWAKNLPGVEFMS